MTQRIVINRPSDPLSGMMDSHRGAYRRKWLIQTPVVANDEERAQRPAMAERSGIADKIRDVFAAHGFGRVE